LDATLLRLRWRVGAMDSYANCICPFRIGWWGQCHEVESILFAEKNGTYLELYSFEN
jgi:hypothetical protein